MKYSRQRELIRQTLREGIPHPTADDVYTQLRPSLPDLSLGTVYRNLGVLVDSGEALRLRVPGGSDRYDVNTHEHGHILCTVCGKLQDCELPPLDAFDRFLAQSTGMWIQAHHILVTGVCARCM